MKTGITFMLVFVAGFLYSQKVSVDGVWVNRVIEGFKDRSYHFKKTKEKSVTTFNSSHGFHVEVRPLVQKLNLKDFVSTEFSIALLGIEKGNMHYPLEGFSNFEVNTNTLIEKHGLFNIEYINTPNGLKQNVVLLQKNQSTGKLILKFGFKGNESVPVLRNGEIIILDKMNSSHELARYNGLKVFDAFRREVPSMFLLDGTNIVVEVNDVDAVYPLTVDPVSTTPSSSVAASQSGTQLGYCVSTAGDVNGDGYTDVIVGAPKYDNPAINEGAAFVYHGSANGISATPSWSMYGVTAGINFGINVSEAGDVNGDGFGDVIVGANLYDNAEADEGRAYVYHGSAGGLSAVANWTFEPDQAGAQFGFIVSTAGDVNNDGFSDVIIGAPYYDNSLVDEGAAFVFHGSGTGLPATANALLEINIAGASFGWSVSSGGDINGDGFDEVLVSGIYYDNGQADEGIVRVYNGTAGGVNTTAAWSKESNVASDYFGENISWAGDVNGDGYGDVIIGADGAGSSDQGQAYVFHGSATGLPGTANSTMGSGIGSSQFGLGVNGAGDLNGDGYGDVLVGCPRYSGTFTLSGATYVYYGSSTGVITASPTILEVARANSQGGFSVCSAGDVNGDGFSDLITGAWVYDNPALASPTTNNAGAFFVYHGLSEGIGTTSFPASPFSGAAANSSTGNFVTTIGDVNRDGFSDIAVGAQNVDIAGTGGTNRGAVYIFHGSATGYASAPNTTIPGPTLGAIAASNNCLFGCSIGAAGDVNGDGFSDIIIGASGYTNGQTSEGYFSIHLGSGAGITVAPHLVVESNLAGAQLGFSVAGAGDVNGDGYSDVIVGGNTYNSGTVNEGKIFVYHGSSTGVNSTVDWTYETNVAEKLGCCVAGIGDGNGDGYSDVVALSSDWSGGQTNEGHIFYFRGSATGLEAAPGTTFETNVANANLGTHSTSYIGDLNGDGFNDIVVGTSAFASGSTAEGALLIYYGAYPSFNFGTTQTVEGNAVNFLLGNTVGFGGDVNGDGYNDVITGAPAFNGGLANEGVARVYLGGPTAVATTPYFTMESNITATLFGSSVSSAGDCNGDGFSDILVGASGFDVTTPSALTDAGRVYVYMGNNSHNVLPKTFLTRQFKSDLATVVQSSNGTFEAGCSFGIGHADKSHLGRASGKQIFEVRGHPAPFTGYATAMGNSVAFTGQQAAFTDLGLTGATMTYGVTAAAMGFPKWRTRTRFRLVDALDGQMNGRWYYGSIHDKQDRSIKINISCGVLPIDLLNINLSCENEKKQLKWEVASEENVAQYKIYASSNGVDYDLIEAIDPGQGNYEYGISVNIESNYIRLEVIDNNLFSTSFDKFLPNCDAQQNNLSAFPSPASEMLTIVIDNGDQIPVEVSVIDLSGRVVLKTDKANMNVSGLVSGIYHVVARDENGKIYTGKFSHY